MAGEGSPPAEGAAPQKKKRRRPKSGKSPVERTIEWLKDLGADLVVKVERWNDFLKIRQDFAGIIDLIAFFGDQTFGVQVCGGDDAAAHVRKILESPNFPKIARAWTVVVVSWREVVMPVGPPQWRPRKIHVKLAEESSSASASTGISSRSSVEPEGQAPAPVP